MKEIKKLCDIKKKKDQFYEEEIKAIIKTPNFMCKKCLRVAKNEKYLCESKSL